MIDADAIKNLIRGIADQRPRNHQAAVGPSEIGGPCARRLGFRLAGIDKVNPDHDPLASLIGTAMHALIDDALQADPDWHTELPVELPAYGITGTLDAYHAPTKTIIDWKLVGASSLRRYKTLGVGEQYRTQVHTYGLALAMTGIDVDHVAIGFIPRSGILAETYVWTEPLDADVVEAALRRYETIRDAVTAAPAQALPLLPTAEQFCQRCPYFIPAGTPPQACGGHKDLAPTGAGETTQHNTEGVLV
jgi:hypothetical protein